VLTSGLT